MAGRISYYGNIVKDGLVLDLDAAKRDSYLYRDWETDRKSTRLNSSHLKLTRMPSSA